MSQDQETRPSIDSLDMIPPSGGVGVDWSLILGVGTAFTLLTLAVTLSGSLSSFFNVPALLVVFIGTFAVTMTSFSLRETLGIFGVILGAMFPGSRTSAKPPT